MNSKRPWLWRRAIALIVLILLLLASYVLYGWYGTPRYQYTVHETKLIVDGEAVTVTGLLECARSPLFFLGALSEGRPYQMVGSPSAATPLVDGGALLVIFPDACGGLSVDKYMYEPGYYPSIYLIDSATNPQRIEYHFSDRSLRDPNARVRLDSFETQRSSSPIRDYRLLARYRWRKSVSSVIPGLIAEPTFFLGYLITVLPIASLSGDEGAAFDASSAHESEIADATSEISPSMQQARDRVSINFVWGSVGHLCQLKTLRGDAGLCDKLRRTYGVPVVDGKPTARTLADLLPYVELCRRSDVLVRGENRTSQAFAPTNVDPITRFFLFDREYDVRAGAFSRAIFLAPDDQVLFGLGVNALSSQQIRQR